MKPAERFEYKYRITVEPGKAHKKEIESISGITRNISSTGIGIRLAKGASLKAGDEINLTLFLWEEDSGKISIPAKARIIWIDEQGEGGVKITWLDDESREVYQHLLEGYEFLLNCVGKAS